MVSIALETFQSLNEQVGTAVKNARSGQSGCTKANES